MNTMKTHKPCRFRSSIVVRLWALMMLLVALSIAFIWVVQIVLFEQNYIDSAIAEVKARLSPILEDIGNEDMAGNEVLASYLSKSINGKMLLFDSSNQLLAAYSYGHPMDMQPEAVAYVWEGDAGAEKRAYLARGEIYTHIIRYDGQAITYEIGVPVTYGGETVYALMYHSLDEVYTVLSINRRQLLVLSIALTVMAAALAAMLSRQFVRPIYRLKDTVDRLAGGDLEATPGIRRSDELGQLSDSVEALGHALKRVDVLRKEVIANVSHEMRSPLSLIIGYAEMVRDISWRDDARREEDLDLIIHEARRMSEMVKDIMDYSQFQAGYIQLNRGWHSLRDIIASEIERSRPAAQAYQIAITEDIDAAQAPAFVDAIKICLVIRNLLHNAINYTKDGETIAISADRQPDGVRIAVINPGKPIPQEEQGVIWERYQRSQHHGGRNQGTGIGLSIVRTILVAHGMRYGVTCGDGRISFWFVCEDASA